MDRLQQMIDGILAREHRRLEAEQYREPDPRLRKPVRNRDQRDGRQFLYGK